MQTCVDLFFLFKLGWAWAGPSEAGYFTLSDWRPLRVAASSHAPCQSRGHVVHDSPRHVDGRLLDDAPTLRCVAVRKTICSRSALLISLPGLSRVINSLVTHRPGAGRFCSVTPRCGLCSLVNHDFINNESATKYHVNSELHDKTSRTDWLPQIKGSVGRHFWMGGRARGPCFPLNCHWTCRADDVLFLSIIRQHC